jgi:hypothetical protein
MMAVNLPHPPHPLMSIWGLFHGLESPLSDFQEIVCLDTALDVALAAAAMCSLKLGLPHPSA